MASAVDLLDSLLLSAVEVRDMTGWPDEMIEDYLNIVRNFASISSVIDDNEGTLQEQINVLEQLTGAQAALIGKLKSINNKQDISLKRLEQLSHAW